MHRLDCLSKVSSGGAENEVSYSKSKLKFVVSFSLHMSNKIPPFINPK